ncbi:MAG: RluA family pseudouridine synthase [Firmicutes bacterium]|nr:RluA family pseudouridine synthase [Bacillota bacterium]
MKEISISANDAGQRLDRFLKKYLKNASLSYVYKALRKDVKVNGRRQKEDYMLCEGDVLQLYIADSELAALTEVRKRRGTAKRQFKVIYEDDDMIAVSKPFGLLVHGDSTEKKDTLANQVTDYLIETGAYAPRLEKSFVPSPVHRLDRNTTGLVVFGKNAAALRTLSLMFREDGHVRKFYYTIVYGCLDRKLHLKNMMVKDADRNRVRVLPLGSPDGKYIETIVRPVRPGEDYSLVEVELVTGRSHQIRAHLAYAGHPVIGDSKYAGRKFAAQAKWLEDNYALSTQLLHAERLEITDAPAPLEHLGGLVLEAPLPENWRALERGLIGE